MKMISTLCTALLYFGSTHLHASETKISQPLFTPAISYEASYQKIQGITLKDHVTFTPLPITLHELFQRNDRANKRHASLHAKLMLTLVHNSNRKKIMNLFAKYGIGIEYEPNKYLVTRLLDINGIGKSITTSFDTSHDTE